MERRVVRESGLIGSLAFKKHRTWGALKTHMGNKKANRVCSALCHPQASQTLGLPCRLERLP